MKYNWEQLGERIENSVRTYWEHADNHMDHIENAKIQKSSQQRGEPLPFQQRGKGGLLTPHLIGCENFPYPYLSSAPDTSWHDWTGMSWARVNQHPTVLHVGYMDMKHFFIISLSHCEPQWLAMYRQPTIHMHLLTYLHSSNLAPYLITYLHSSNLAPYLFTYLPSSNLAPCLRTYYIVITYIPYLFT